MRPVLQDSQLQQLYDQNGYVMIDFLDESEFGALFQLMEELKEEGRQFEMNVESEYKLSFFASSPEWRMKVFQRVSDFFTAKANRFLDDYVPLIINLFDKEPGGGEVPVHQNWSFVDESRYRSVSVWIPLCDVSRANGTLEVIAGSHDTLTEFRSPSIPWVFDGLWDPLREKYLQPLNLRRGQAGIIDDAIIHWSSDNDTDAVRSTIQLIMVPREATPIHYYRNPENPEQLEIFAVDAEFFTRFQMHEKPVGVQKIGEINGFHYHKLSEAELVEKVSVRNPHIKALV
ncbi:MAG: phytanoyl-CoA dioxygenase family protein [Bacteroidia bacterium]|nr:phytanoyl-CoA dioxygenase family protein [Bacteroidia bacterium]